MSEIKFKELVFSVIKNYKKVWNKDKTELKLNLLINLLENYDEEIISLLLENERIKKKFFVKINEIYIFKINDFKFFMEENKINNSYTEYKNLIGLSDGNRFLKHSNDIVLDFPFKDCILQGGQTAEDKKDFYYEYDEKVSETNKKKYAHKEKNYNKKENKRNEIFFNKIIAEDEIDRLLDEKTLINFKKFDKNGEKKLDEFKRNKNGTIKDNLIIKGNNLIALHSLKKQFAGKIKLIYIDPPYNTGNDGFMYNDNFNHSTWLTFMKNRLEIAKELLKNDGVIFVQCDDNEQAYLKILMDEIFGRDNFIASLVRKTGISARLDAKHISKEQDYILFYSKNEKILYLNKEEVSNLNTYKHEDKFKKIRGKYKLNKLDRGSINYSEKMDFPIKTSENTFIYPGGEKKKNNWCWRWSKEKVKWGIENNFILIKKIKNKWSVYFKQYQFVDNNCNLLNRKNPYKTLLVKNFNNEIGSKEILNLFEKKKIFSYPKPENLIKILIEIATKENDIVLDFHLGSGTTAAVCHKMNRQYIGVEQMDYIEEISVSSHSKVFPY